MRRRLLLVAALLTQGCGPEGSELRQDAGSSNPGDPEVWLYDPASRFHGVIPIAVQQMRHPDPIAVAEAVCGSLGGWLDFTQPPSPDRSRIGFNCAFAEPDLTITREFGELRRIRNIE